MWMATSPELVAGPRSQWPARYASRSAVRPWRPAPTSSSASASSGPFSVSSTVFPASSRRSDLRLSSFNVTMGSGMANLQYASCLDNLNHTEAGRALPSIWTLFRCQSAQNIVRYHMRNRTAVIAFGHREYRAGSRVVSTRDTTGIKTDDCSLWRPLLSESPPISSIRLMGGLCIAWSVQITPNHISTKFRYLVADYKVSAFVNLIISCLQ